MIHVLPCLWTPDELSDRFSPAKLYRGQPSTPRGLTDSLRGLIHEHTHLLDMRRQCLHNFVHGLRVDFPRTLVIENESQSIRPRFHRGQRVLEIRDSANLYPSHETQFSVLSCQFSV